MSDQTQFLDGDRVRYVPWHAHGDPQHRDCQLGVVTSTNHQCVFVRIDGLNFSLAYDRHTLELVSRP